MTGMIRVSQWSKERSLCKVDLTSKFQCFFLESSDAIRAVSATSSGIIASWELDKVHIPERPDGDTRSIYDCLLQQNGFNARKKCAVKVLQTVLQW